MNLLGFIMSLVYMQAVHGWLSAYERLVNSQFMLADGRENFIKHPVFKSFCRWQLAVNDQPVNITFHDKGNFNDLLSSIPILIQLLNDPLAFR